MRHELANLRSSGCLAEYAWPCRPSATTSYDSTVDRLTKWSLRGGRPDANFPGTAGRGGPFTGFDGATACNLAPARERDKRSARRRYPFSINVAELDSRLQSIGDVEGHAHIAGSHGWRSSRRHGRSRSRPICRPSGFRASGRPSRKGQCRQRSPCWGTAPPPPRLASASAASAALAADRPAAARRSRGPTGSGKSQTFRGRRCPGAAAALREPTEARTYPARLER